jgi:acetyl-CoA carboxylase biotin carboxylase subunit
MFKKILIANRGEVAARIIRAAKELDIKTVVVYSDVDISSLPTQIADEAICIGPADPDKSYLDPVRIITAAKITGAEAIHPGYGFLSENPKFAEICQEHYIKFIGPSKEAIELMGNKVEAKKLAASLDIPVIPGALNPPADIEEAKAQAAEIGYPVILKAALGGGGRGMRIAYNEEELISLFDIAKAESESGFGSQEIYIEKYIPEPRHIEVQILADEYGNIVHLFERECSIQLRYQKLIEEAPSPIVDKNLRKKITQAAVKLAKKVNYQNAGTVEFLLDKDKNFYFIEMNTRLQVEHPVTEFITNIDIVKEQIKIAAGERLGFKQQDIKFSGHAIECRIIAADRDKDFAPVCGHIKHFHIPQGPGVRVDTYLLPEYDIPSEYDALLAKVITYGKTRDEAISRMKRALSELWIDGIKTIIPFHQDIMNDEEFRKGRIHTHFLSYITKIS